jgi:D-hydroxyproline dehydrogenase subunit alpha
MKNYLIAIIGAGPSGVSILKKLSTQSVFEIDLFDEQSRLGGNINRKKIEEKNDEIENLIANNSKVNFYNKTSVFSITENNEVSFNHSNSFQKKKYDFICLCTGAFDTFFPKKGYNDQKNITSVGFLQAVLKNSEIIPSGKIILAGSGPYLHVVGSDLLKAGGNVVQIIDGLSLFSYVKLFFVSMLVPKNIILGIKNIIYLKIRKVKIHFNNSIKEIDNLKVTLKNKIKVDFEHLGISDIFVSQIQLHKTCNLNIKLNYLKNNLVAVVNNNYQSSNKNIYVGGEGSGVFGSFHAQISGQIIANDIIKRTRSVKNFFSFIHIFYATYLKMFGEIFEKEMLKGMNFFDKDSLICVCEKIKTREIEKLIDFGVKDFNSIKISSRCGMGSCQGKYCETNLVNLFRQKNISIKSFFNQSNFTKPITVKDFLNDKI